MHHQCKCKQLCVALLHIYRRAAYECTYGKYGMRVKGRNLEVRMYITTRHMCVNMYAFEWQARREILGMKEIFFFITFCKIITFAAKWKFIFECMYIHLCVCTCILFIALKYEPMHAKQMQIAPNTHQHTCKQTHLCIYIQLYLHIAYAWIFVFGHMHMRLSALMLAIHQVKCNAHKVLAINWTEMKMVLPQNEPNVHWHTPTNRRFCIYACVFELKGMYEGALFAKIPSFPFHLCAVPLPLWPTE